MKKIRGYNFSRSFMGERVPQHVQNIVIKDYCAKNNLNFLLSVTEYSMPNSYYMLNSLIKNSKNISGVVMYSLFQMPEIDSERKKMFYKFLKKKKKIFFACENLKFESLKDFKRLENIWFVKKLMSEKI